MLIPSETLPHVQHETSLSRRVNANSQLTELALNRFSKLIKKGEC